MPSYVTPKKGVEFIFYISLVSQANTKVMQSNPTIAAGDFKVSVDGGALANPATLPAVTPASSKMVKVTLSTSEMNGDNITLIASDASGAEWCDLVVNIQTSARQIDDLAYPTTSGRSLDVTATGAAGIDWGNIENPTTTVGLSGTTVKTATDVETDTQDIQARLPAALVTGRIDASVGAMASNTITAAAIATDAIDADAIAANAVTEIQSGLATQASVDTIDANVDAILADTGTDGVVVAAASKTGYSLSAAGIQAIWDALTSALTTVGSIGKLLVDNIDATISSRLASASYTTPPTAAAIADQVWDETLADHLGAGSTGNALNAAGSAGDPWSTALPGAYGAGTAGKIIGDNINATISSRATQTSVDTIDDFLDTEIAAIKAKTDALPADPADASDIAASFVTVNGKLDTIDDFLDTEVAAILADTNELQTDWTDGGRLDLLIDAIKAKTDNLPADPADDSDIDAQLATISGFLDTEVAAILAAVDTEVGAIKTVTDALTSAAAAKLALSAGTIVVASAVSGTLSTTQMTTDLTEATNDHFNGRIIIWTSGALQYQATDITDYDGATKMLTFTAITEAPTAGDDFVIV